MALTNTIEFHLFSRMIITEMYFNFDSYYIKPDESMGFQGD